MLQRALDFESRDMGSSPSFAADRLCDLGQVPCTLWALGSLYGLD